MRDEFKNFKFTGPLRPGKINPYSVPHRKVPDHINKPDYAKTSIPTSEL